VTGPFIPGPPVPPLPKADPNAPGAQPGPQLDAGGVPIKPPPFRGNFNPNMRIDTSTTTSSGPPPHYQAGHTIGRALGQHLVMAQVLAEIERLMR
jgi:hypothetical protein